VEGKTLEVKGDAEVKDWKAETAKRVTSVVFMMKYYIKYEV
jgi:hypothetical protein